MADNNESKIVQAIESNTAKGLARIIAPLLLALIAWIGNEAWGELQTQGQQITSIAVDVAQTKSELKSFKSDAEQSRADTKERMNRMATFMADAIARVNARIDDLTRR